MVSTVMHRRPYYPDLSHMGKLKQRQYCEAPKNNYLNDHWAHKMSSFPSVQRPKLFKMNQYKLKWILWNNHGRMKRSIPSASDWDEWKWVAFNELGSKFYKNQKADLSNQLECRDVASYSNQNENVLKKFQYPPAPDNIFNSYSSPDKEISAPAPRHNTFKPPPPPPLKHKDSKTFDASLRSKLKSSENPKPAKKRGRKPKNSLECLVSDKEDDPEKLVINFDNSDIEDLLNTIENSGENLSNIVNNTNITIQNSTTSLKDLSSLIKANNLLGMAPPQPKHHKSGLDDGSSPELAPSSCPQDIQEQSPAKPTTTNHIPGGVRSACQAATLNTVRSLPWVFMLPFSPLQSLLPSKIF